MNRKTSMSVAYYLVTSAFTFGLLILIFIVMGLLASGEMSYDVNIDVELGSFHDMTSIKDESAIIWRFEPDSVKEGQVIRKQPLDVKSVIEIPVDYLYPSNKLYYYFYIIRFFIHYIAWLYIAYQTFLILYDAKRKIFFIAANIARMRKMGLAFLLMSLLYLPSFDYKGKLQPGEALYLWQDRSIQLWGNCLLYFLIASLVFVFASFFQEGKQLKDEGELTI